MKTPAFLIDTNIWVDYELPRDNYEEVKSFFHSARAHGTRLGIAAHSLKDAFNVIERRIKQIEHIDPRIEKEHVGPAARASAWAAVDYILEHAEVVGTDYMDAYLACKDRVFHDFYEDNLVVAAARRMEADLLVTNDTSLLKHAPVPALSTAAAIEWLEINA